MKNKKKLIVFIICFGVLFVILGIVLVFLNDEKKKNNSDIPSEEEVVEEKEEFEIEDKHEDDGIILQNLEITKIENDIMFLIRFEITNTTDISYDKLNITIRFLRENGTPFYDLPIYIGELKKGETKTFECTTPYDFTIATDYKLLSNY